MCVTGVVGQLIISKPSSESSSSLDGGGWSTSMNAVSVCVCGGGDGWSGRAND